MQLQDFLINHTSSSTLSNYPAICFTGKQYPTLFFCALKRVWHDSAIRSIDMIELADDAIYGQLDMSFLGQRSLFWLAHFHDLDAKRNKQFSGYLSQYQGPNTVLLYAPTAIKMSKGCISVELADAVDEEMFAALFSYLYPTEKKRNTSFIKLVFKKYPSLPLDTACLLMEYALVVGGQAELMTKQWLDDLVAPDNSLFMLSTYLFAKREKEFFALWSAMQEAYGDPFWTTYWSEQFFRAYGFIQYSQERKFAHAKKIAYRLPFSFIQKDWKKNSIEKIMLAHKQLYEIDWRIKNGLAASFEVMFLKYFN